MHCGVNAVALSLYDWIGNPDRALYLFLSRGALLAQSMNLDPYLFLEILNWCDNGVLKDCVVACCVIVLEGF